MSASLPWFATASPDNTDIRITFVWGTSGHFTAGCKVYSRLQIHTRSDGKIVEAALKGMMSLTGSLSEEAYASSAKFHPARRNAYKQVTKSLEGRANFSPTMPGMDNYWTKHHQEMKTYPPGYLQQTIELIYENGICLSNQTVNYPSIYAPKENIEAFKLAKHSPYIVYGSSTGSIEGYKKINFELHLPPPEHQEAGEVELRVWWRTVENDDDWATSMIDTLKEAARRLSGEHSRDGATGFWIDDVFDGGDIEPVTDLPSVLDFDPDTDRSEYRFQYRDGADYSTQVD